jgi:hypothetical protein
VGYPEDGETEDFHDEERCPGPRGGVLAGPEKGLVNGICLKFLIVALEPPHFLPVLVKVVPPAQPHQQPSRHVLDCPEVQCAEQYDQDEGVDVAEEVAQDEVAACGERYTKKAVALNRKVKMQATGCAAFERPPYTGFRLSWTAAFALRGSVIDYNQIQTNVK